MHDGIGCALRLRDRLRRRDVPLGSIDLRPLWRGQAFARHADAPMPMRRAQALAAVLEGVALPIRDEELLVGTPAGALAAALPPGVSEDEFQAAAALNAAVGERTFITNLDHAAPDYAHLVEVGLGGLRDKVAASRQRHTDAERLAFLEGVDIALAAAQRYVARWAEACRADAARAAPARAVELRAMAADLDRLIYHPPETFRQALQLVWLAHVIFCLEGRGAMAFGRMDQYLWPYYREELEAGSDSNCRAALASMWAKLEEPLIPNPVQNIAIGGVTRAGEDATNPLSYALLEVTRAVGTPNSNLSARIHSGTPDAFLDACVGVIVTGIGFPALFNDEVLIAGLTDLGIPLEEARDYAFVGCIETYLPGRMPPWSDSRVNLLAAVDRALRAEDANGEGVVRDALTGEPTGLPTGTGAHATFEAFLEAYDRQVEHLVAAHCETIRERKRTIRDENYPSPFLSALVQDCIARGLDVNAGGARFTDLHGPAGMGLGSTADALAAIRRAVYDEGYLTLAELRAALDADFVGHEPLRRRLLAAPKYGNGDAYVDEIAAHVVRVFTTAVLRERTPRGGRFVPLMAANVANIAAGKELGATPDGRRTGEPVSDAASPTFGRDRQGPTALIRSLTTVDYRPVVGGTVVNVRFAPGTVAGPEGSAALVALVRAYFRGGGMQMQFNVTGRALLEEALHDPEAHRNLVVRVSGFSALYVNLAEAVKKDILARTEY